MPKVSVIVPVYNTEKYMRRCLESILSQTYTDLEVILVDDGSIDKSGEICDEYAEKDSRIKVIHKKNEGVSYARIDGYNHSMGEYITFVDSDDTIVERYIEIMLKELLSKNVDVVCCQNNDINDGIISFIKKKDSGLYNKEQLRKFMSRNLLYDRETSVSGLPLFLCAKLYKRDILKNIISNGIGYWYGEDQIVIISMLYNINSLSFIEDRLYNYYHYDEHVSRKYREDKWDAVVSLWRRLLELDKDGLLANQLPYRMWNYAMTIFYENIPIISDYKDYKNKTKKIFEHNLVRKYIFNVTNNDFPRCRRETYLYFLLKNKLYWMVYIHIKRIKTHINNG